MLKAVMFDLDGTLLPINEDLFLKGYLNLISSYMEKYGYNKEELINNILFGTKLMAKNSGTETNAQIFWKEFENIYGKKVLNDIPHFNEFYANEFHKTKQFCSENPLAKEILDFCKSNNIKTILSTNPFFPRTAVTTRLSFLGLTEQDFDYISDYENSHFSKINPEFYAEIIQKLDINAENVVLFGNNEIEDCVNSKKVGIHPYLVLEENSNHRETEFETVTLTQVIDILKSKI